MKFENITAVRQEIDRLDTELVALIARRGECVNAAAHFKTDADAVRAPDRVQQVIDKVRQQAVLEGLAPEIIEPVYRAMIAAFIEYELQEHQKLNVK